MVIIPSHPAPCYSRSVSALRHKQIMENVLVRAIGRSVEDLNDGKSHLQSNGNPWVGDFGVTFDADDARV